MTHGGIPVETRERLGISSGLVRMSVGVEEKEDLIVDVERALRWAVKGEVWEPHVAAVAGGAEGKTLEDGPKVGVVGLASVDMEGVTKVLEEKMGENHTLGQVVVGQV